MSLQDSMEFLEALAAIEDESLHLARLAMLALFEQLDAEILGEDAST